MTRPLVLRREAESDLAAARDWYNQQRVGLGEEFLDCVQAKLDEIERTPAIHAAEYRDVRRGKTRRFPFVIYFRLHADRIEVLAVLHARRNPSVWRKRAQETDA